MEIKNMKKNMPFLLILLSLGVIFLLFSEYHSNKDTNVKGDDFDEEGYVLQLEERLKHIIEKIDGVSEVNVMITLESGKRYTFLQDEENPNGTDISTFLMKEKNEVSSPILVETSAPKIKGVSVVCHGAKNALIREKILRLVAGTLDLTQNKIFVTQ